jgi:hypothetical protein
VRILEEIVNDDNYDCGPSRFGGLFVFRGSIKPLKLGGFLKHCFQAGPRVDRLRIALIFLVQKSADAALAKLK